MDKISSKNIRDKFLSFFKQNDHMRISDSSIIPKNDPTLLFINSGMAPIKNYFTGVENPPYPKLCNVQPCIRTIDIDSVGDKHHLTSFQMLGSWSINNYFKEEAISLAWNFLTECLGIPEGKLYVTIFGGDKDLNLDSDKEAREYWGKVGVPEEHIIECGKEDNFWGPTSETGPCGPCTEIFYDTGEGEEYVLGGEFDTKSRYIEIWNAGVFMQFNKNADGSYSPLSFTSVDTGAGLERLAMVMNGHKSVYETDLLSPIKDFIEKQISIPNAVLERDMLIMTDHLRTAALILSELIKPSNEGRGYIPRKLIRRCMMITGKAKLQNFDFIKVIEFIVDKYADMFPNFVKNRVHIIREIKSEQEQFGKVLKEGLARLEVIRSNCKSISGDDAFDLVTTYGLPFDIIKQFAGENSMQVSEDEFLKKLNEHKEKSRNIGASNGASGLTNIAALLSDCSATKFLGYDDSNCEATVLKIIKDSVLVDEAGADSEVALILNQSVMYAESGGQCADKGYIYNDSCKIKITDVKKLGEGIFVHSGVVESGKIVSGDNVTVETDALYSEKITNNHTAVHLLHSALRNVYGKNLHQAGSKVESQKLRFDFNYDQPIMQGEIFKIESLVNSYIRMNLERKVETKSVQEAIQDGAIALFESKYADDVRVVSYGDISKELCGGTHTARTGNIGLFVIASAEGIGKGIKRITALTGQAALEYIQKKSENLDAVAKMFKVKPDDIVQKVEKYLTDKSNVKGDSKSDKITISDVKYIETKLDYKCGYIVKNEASKKNMNDVMKIANEIKGVLVCISGQDKKQIMVAVSDAQSEKTQANTILDNIMKLVGGKGGGNKKVATGGVLCRAEQIIGAIKKVLQ